MNRDDDDGWESDDNDIDAEPPTKSSMDGTVHRGAAAGFRLPARPAFSLASKVVDEVVVVRGWSSSWWSRSWLHCCTCCLTAAVVVAANAFLGASEGRGLLFLDGGCLSGCLFWVFWVWVCCLLPITTTAGSKSLSPAASLPSDEEESDTITTCVAAALFMIRWWVPNSNNKQKIKIRE